MKKDYVGQKFGRLTVLERLPKYRHGLTFYRCICDCGNETIVYSGQFVCGKTKSCGCLAKEMAKTIARTHGMRYTQLYKTWAGIKDRTNPKNHNNKYNYKKLHISMCDEWKNSFEAFRDWALANGYKEEKLPNGRNKYEIDRIDTYGNYEPSNCRWATSKEQMNNQTTNKRITYNGKTQTLSQWCDELKFNYKLVNQRLWSGWNVERAFNESSDKKNYYEYKGKTLNKKQICEITGLTMTNLENRLHRKWDIERIMTQPVRKFKEQKNNV